MHAICVFILFWLVQKRIGICNLQGFYFLNLWLSTSVLLSQFHCIIIIPTFINHQPFQNGFQCSLRTYCIETGSVGHGEDPDDLPLHPTLLMAGFGHPCPPHGSCTGLQVSTGSKSTVKRNSTNTPLVTPITVCSATCSLVHCILFVTMWCLRCNVYTKVRFIIKLANFCHKNIIFCY